MDDLIKIYIPLCDENETFYRGHVDVPGNNLTNIYLTKFSCKPDFIPKNGTKTKTVYCYRGDNAPKTILTQYNMVILKSNMQVKQIVINGEIKSTNNTMVLLYDYNKFRDSQTISGAAEDFIELQNSILKEYGTFQAKTVDKTYSITKPYWLMSSMFLLHLSNYLNLIRWLMAGIRKDKKISIKIGNLLLAVVTDVILGYILINVVSENTKHISTQVMELLEKIINMLFSLLMWLMGAPVGLKLNNAFNKTLGKYFTYHVQLWWLFLETCSKKLDIILNMYQYIGYFGFTFQIAIISDLICIATFHSYCIYVYAARLFNIQISGLIALLRLFVGRKYNPLRNSIDSCEYTNQELFVGTVAFTILLLLLPTTAMYYIVFTLFRVVSLLFQHILANIIYIIQSLPLYVATLWAIGSPKVAGNIFIETEQKQNSMPLIIKVKLFSKSIFELLETFRPPVEVPKQVEWTNVLSNALMGKQII